MQRNPRWSLLIIALLLAACGRGALEPTSSPEATARLIAATATPTASPTPSPTTRPSATVAPSATATASPTPSPPPPTPEPQEEDDATATIEPRDPPAALPAATGGVRVTETSLTLATYGYEAARQQTEPDDPIYPYPRLDQEQVTGAVPKVYRAVVLENDYVAVTILPELGGRIYRWVDKTTGQHLLYENPVVKPTGWGYRGWWLAAGGIEFAFPVEEHGLNEWRPWDISVQPGSETATIVVSDVEDQTGMTVGATITLGAASSALEISPWVENTTNQEQTFQYWLNAMVTLGNNRVSDATQLIFPTAQVIVHSTGDETLPGAWETMDWPLHDGRDMSVYGNWDNYLGFFVPEIARGFAALYDPEADQGIVRAFTPGPNSGSKFFGPGTLPSWLWTDDDSTYVELWGGITPTFGDTMTIGPGDHMGWSERWYPVHGLSTVTTANAGAALTLLPDDSGYHVGCAVTQPMVGTLALWIGGETVARWDLDLTPAEPFEASWDGEKAGEAEVGLRLYGSAGEPILTTNAVP